MRRLRDAAARVGLIRWRSVSVERRDGKVDSWGAGVVRCRKRGWEIRLRDGRRVLYPARMVKAVMTTPVRPRKRQEPVVYG